MVFEAVNRTRNRILMNPQASALCDIGILFPAIRTEIPGFIYQTFTAPHAAGLPDIYNLLSAVRADPFPVYFPAERTDRGIQESEQAL